MLLQQRQVLMPAFKSFFFFKLDLKFLLLMDSVKNEESVKNFFVEVYELVVKVKLYNFFYDCVLDAFIIFKLSLF